VARAVSPPPPARLFWVGWGCCPRSPPAADSVCVWLATLAPCVQVVHSALVWLLCLVLVGATALGVFQSMSTFGKSLLLTILAHYTAASAGGVPYLPLSACRVFWAHILSVHACLKRASAMPCLVCPPAAVCLLVVPRLLYAMTTRNQSKGAALEELVGCVGPRRWPGTYPSLPQAHARAS
jgi:hypothetical protein